VSGGHEYCTCERFPTWTQVCIYLGGVLVAGSIGAGIILALGVVSAACRT
jgi:hypothetical protein